MKRIILSSILTVFMFFNTTLSSLNRPEISVANGVPANATFYQEKISNDLTRFNDYKVIYDGLVTSRVAIAGTTRLFLNIYNDNYNLVDQYIFSSLDYPSLVSASIVAQSKPIRVDDKVYIFFRQGFISSGSLSYRNHLIEIDISDGVQSLKSYSFSYLPNDVLISSSSNLELDYIDNKIHLLISNSISSFSAFIINLGDTLTSNFYPSTTTAVINSTIVGDANNLKDITEASVLGVCYRFNSTVYCKEKNNANDFYSLTLTNNLTNVLISNQKSLVTRTTHTSGGITTDVVVYYEIRKNANNDGLEATNLTVLDLSYALDGARNNQTVFPHINRATNEFKVWSIATSYKFNYQTSEVTLGGFQPALYEDVFYNSDGKKILVSKQGDNIYASSDFYKLTFVINLANHNVLAYNYYEDDLLIFAYDTSQTRYAYYRYPILPTSGGSSLVKQFDITDAELRASLAFAYGLQTYVTAIQIEQVIFYKDAVYMLDTNILSGGQVTDKLNFIQIIPLGNGKRIDTFYNVFTNNDRISLVFANSLDLHHRLGSYYLTVKVAQLNGTPVEVNAYIGTEEFNNAAASASLKFIYYYDDPTVSIDDSKVNYNGFPSLSFIQDEGLTRQLVLDVARLRVQDYYGPNPVEVNTDLPPQILELYGLSNYPSLYTDFDYYFFSTKIFHRLDDHGNLIFKDAANNIYTLYSRKFLKLNNPGLISINNEFLDINANSFDLAVSANINTININIRSLFNRVLVTNPTPITLNNGQNVINITLKSLDNTINSITFNIFKAPTVVAPPAIVLPGPDPNYVPPTSSAQSSSVVSSSVISSSISSSSTTSSAIISSSSSNAITSSSSSSISGGNPTTNQPENPLNIWIILAIPALITGAIIGYAKLVKGRSKSEVKVDVKKDEVEIPNSENKDKQ